MCTLNTQSCMHRSYLSTSMLGWPQPLIQNYVHEMLSTSNMGPKIFLVSLCLALAHEINFTPGGEEYGSRFLQEC